MKLNIQRLIYAVLLPLVAVMAVSCDRVLNTESDLGLKEENHYKTPDEVYAAFLGIQTTVQHTADQTVILPELRGDLLQPTQNATENFWKMYRFQPESGGYSTPRPYYDVVIHCNDFIRHLFIYLEEQPGNIPDAVRDGMVSAAINCKVWATMMAGKLFGSACFFHTSLDGMVADTLLPEYTLAELPDVLMAYMRQGESGIDAYQPLDWKLILSPGVEAPEWATVNFNPEVLEGELLLWAGRYQEAARVLMGFISNPSWATSYKINAKWTGMNWHSLFVSPYSDLREEIITGIPFDRLERQQNKLQYYFSAIHPNVYYMSPTDAAVALFNRQQGLEKSGDVIRGMASFTEENGVRVVAKYHLDREKDEFAHDAKVHLYRAADVHLMLAEAYCFMGEYEAALAFVNTGLASWFDNAANDFRPPFNGVHSSMKNSSKGIRGRAGLVTIEPGIILTEGMSGRDSLKTVASVIADEVALELAYEGKRWFTLVRMARNLQDNDFLALPVSLKFPQGEQATWREFLKNEQYWFVKATE